MTRCVSMRIIYNILRYRFRYEITRYIPLPAGPPSEVASGWRNNLHYSILLHVTHSRATLSCTGTQTLVHKRVCMMPLPYPSLSSIRASVKPYSELWHDRPGALARSASAIECSPPLMPSNAIRGEGSQVAMRVRHTQPQGSSYTQAQRV